MLFKLVRRSQNEGGALCFSRCFSAAGRKPEQPCLPGKQVWKIMKLSAILLFVACMHVSAKGFSQITLSEKNTPLQKVFKKIERQTGYEFLCPVDLLQKAGTVTIELSNATLADAMQAILAGKNLGFTISDKTIVIRSEQSPPLMAAGEPMPLLDIHGRVVNEKGEPVAGATVTEKGTRNATATDDNGEFVLKGVDENGILVISGVNIETEEVKVKGKAELGNLATKLKVAEEEEISVKVNTGYQVLPKERATGSFSFIDNATLNQQTGTNILQRLEGVTSGLIFNVGKQNNNPQNSTGITIRGLSTINGGLDPLIVVDGFVYESNIENINPNDIENITILKDAAAASIWGARAGNGVIVISTKRGKLNQKLQVGFNANVIVNSKPDIFYLPQMKSSDIIDVEQTLFNNGYFDDRINWEPFFSITPAVQIFQEKRLRNITAEDSAKKINALKNIDSRKEYSDYFYRNAVAQQYMIDLKGGGAANSYSISIGHDESLNEFYDKNKKTNVGINNTFYLSNRFQINIGAYYTHTLAQSGRNVSYNSIIQQGDRQVPYLKFSDDAREPISIPTIYSDEFIDTVGGGKLLNWKFYPLENYKYEKAKTELQDVFAFLGIQYKLNSFIDIDIKYQFQKQQTDNEQLEDPESFAARNLINSFTQIDNATGVVTYIVPVGGIKTTVNNKIRSNTIRGQINVNRQMNRHQINMILGGEIREIESDSRMNTIYGYNSDPLTQTNIDPVNYYPTFPFGNYQQIPLQNSLANNIDRFISLFGNGAYTFNGKYTLSLSARKDGSNIFGANTNDKWKPLWSTGISWNISKENFYSNKSIPYLRARLTYGYSGNVDLSRSATTIGTYYSATAPLNLPFARINVLSNPELRWEKTGIVNMGLDFSLINNVLNGSIEYYSKKSTDLYGASPYDYTTWGLTSSIIKNVASIRAKGIDIMLNSRILNKGLKWNLGLIFNYNTDKTIKYEDLSSSRINSLLGGGSMIIPVVGKPLYSISAYRWGGLDNLGNPQGYLNNQLSTDYQAIFDEGRDKGIEGNIKYIGPANPTFFGNLINTISWRGFELTANISYRLGYYFQKPSLSYSSLIYSGAGNSEFSKRWQKPGDEHITNVPSFIYPNDDNRDIFYGYSEINVLKADNIRLQYLNLSYSINSNAFKSLQVYINAANLGLIWKANNEGLDPDYPNVIPKVKSFAIGIRTQL